MGGNPHARWEKGGGTINSPPTRLVKKLYLIEGHCSIKMGGLALTNILKSVILPPWIFYSRRNLPCLDLVSICLTRRRGLLILSIYRSRKFNSVPECPKNVVVPTVSVRPCGTTTESGNCITLAIPVRGVWSMSDCVIPCIIVVNATSIFKSIRRTSPLREAITPTKSSRWPFVSSSRMGCLIGRRVGICDVIIVFSCLS